jgi:hypothetical protein
MKYLSHFICDKEGTKGEQNGTNNKSQNQF